MAGAEEGDRFGGDAAHRFRQLVRAHEVGGAVGGDRQGVAGATVLAEIEIDPVRADLQGRIDQARQ
jgi:hypothetical protein